MAKAFLVQAEGFPSCHYLGPTASKVRWSVLRTLMIYYDWKRSDFGKIRVSRAPALDRETALPLSVVALPKQGTQETQEE